MSYGRYEPNFASRETLQRETTVSNRSSLRYRHPFGIGEEPPGRTTVKIGPALSQGSTRRSENVAAMDWRGEDYEKWKKEATLHIDLDARNSIISSSLLAAALIIIALATAWFLDKQI